MSIASAATGPRSISGCARIAAITRAAPFEPGQSAERVGAAVERERERRERRTRRSRRTTDARVDVRRAGDLREQLLLEGVRRRPVAVRLETAVRADGQESGVLARAGVVDRVGAAPVSRSASVAPACASSVRTASSCSGRARCEAHAIAISRSARSGRAADERKRLQRLRGRAEERDETRIARFGDDLARRARRRRGPRGPPRRHCHGSPRPDAGSAIRGGYAACPSCRKSRLGARARPAGRSRACRSSGRGPGTSRR